jgi:hypothetical protein
MRFDGCFRNSLSGQINLVAPLKVALHTIRIPLVLPVTQAPVIGGAYAPVFFFINVDSGCIELHQFEVYLQIKASYRQS